MKSWMISIVFLLLILLTISITANIFFIFKKGVLNNKNEEDILGFINNRVILEQNLKPHQIDEYRRNKNIIYNIIYDFMGELALEDYIKEKNLNKDNFLSDYSKNHFPIKKEELIALENQKKEEGMSSQEASLVALSILENENILKSYNSILKELFSNNYFTINQKMKERYLYQIPEYSRPQTSKNSHISFFLDYQNQESKMLYLFLRNLEKMDPNIYPFKIHFFPTLKSETSIEILSYAYCVWKTSGDKAFFEVSDYLFQTDDSSHKKAVLLDHLKTKGFYEEEIKTCASQAEVRQEILKDYDLAMNFGALNPPITIAYGRKFLGLILQKEFADMVKELYLQQKAQ